MKVCEHGKPIDPQAGAPPYSHRPGYCSICNPGHKTHIVRAQGYPVAVAWIAENDCAGELSPVDEIAGFVSTLLVADLYGVNAERVAFDVIAYRHKHKIGPYKGDKHAIV